MAKKAYRVRNWPQYNKALVQRGSITFWINERLLKKWYKKDKGLKSRGRPRKFSDIAIETCIVMKVLFKLTYRQCQGFIDSICSLLKLKLKSPCYTQLCRRQRQLDIKLQHNVKGPIHAVIDATGLKIFGEGEWKVRQHGYSKRRMWRKLHVGIDVKSKQFVMAELTDNHIGENKLFKPLLNQYSDGYTKIGGDKAYDSYECHEEIGKRGAKSAIILQKKAKIRKRKTSKTEELVRDEIVRRMRKVGRKKWKEEVDYHSRSLVENAFFRYKTIFGRKLRSHSIENQKIEALIACNILNKFTQIGMCHSYVI
jgi:hypothetical protein